MRRGSRGTRDSPFVSLFFVTLGKTRRRGRHDNLVFTFCLAQCDPRPPSKNPGHAPIQYNFKMI